MSSWKIFCLICGTCETNNFDKQDDKVRLVCQRFGTFASRYMSFHKSPFKPASTVLNVSSPEDWQVCNDCTPTVDSFCEVYAQWQYLQLQLDWKLVEIAEIMGHKSHPGGMDEKADYFRKSFLGLVDKTWSSNAPRVILHSTTKTQGNDEISQADDMAEDIPNVEAKTSHASHNVVAGQEPKFGEPNSRKFEDNEYYRPFKCSKCSNSYRKKTGLQRHMMGAHSNMRPFKCGICGKGFHRPDCRNEHEENVHKALSKLTRPLRKKSSPQVGATEEEHSQGLSCPAAVDNIDNNDQIEANEQKPDIRRGNGTSVSSNETDGDSHLSTFQCPTCSKSFKNLNALNGHSAVHVNQGPFKCRGCNRGYYSKEGRDKHEQRKTHGKKKRKVPDEAEFPRKITVIIKQSSGEMVINGNGPAPPTNISKLPAVVKIENNKIVTSTSSPDIEFVGYKIKQENKSNPSSPVNQFGTTSLHSDNRLKMDDRKSGEQSIPKFSQVIDDGLD